jgi:hypothetical protein
VINARELLQESLLGNGRLRGVISPKERIPLKQISIPIMILGNMYLLDGAPGWE